jgi:hypothetical protein
MIAVCNDSNVAEIGSTTEGLTLALVDRVCEMMARATSRERRLRVMWSDGGAGTQPL